MKRVLVISYYWPPSGGSGVQRWVKFAKYLPSEGWQPVIYTPSNPEYTAVDHSLEADIPAQAEIIRRPILEPYGIYRALMGKGASVDIKSLTAGAREGEVTEISSGKKSFKQRLSLWIRGNLFVPDPRVTWLRPSVRFLCKYLKEHPVDVIVTTGPPQSMHLIGEKVHAKTGIPWIADFRDPWTQMYYLKHLPLTRCSWNKLYRQESRVLGSCTAILTVTPLMKAEFEKASGRPVELITNGFDTDDYKAPAAVPGEFCLVHTGLFSADGNPLVLWKVLSELSASMPELREKLRICLAGRTDVGIKEAIAAAGLEACTTDMGYLSHADAVALQRSAALLLLPLRQDPQYKPILPGKLFEYLASGVQILGIGQTDGAMAQVLSESGAGVTADWDDAATVRNTILAAWERFCSGTPFPPGKGVEAYSRDALTARLAALLEKVTRNGQEESA